MQFIEDLDWHTLRLGAFHVLASVAERSVDTPEALTHRFKEVLFHKIYFDDPAFQKFVDYLDKDAFARIQDRAGKVRPNPAAEIMPTEREVPWFYTVELWQCFGRLPSAGVGPIAEEHAHRYLDLGIKFGLLTPTFASSERGELLRSFFHRAHRKAIDPTSPIPNPLLVDDLGCRAVFVDSLLREDVLTFLTLSELLQSPEGYIARAYRKVGGDEQPGILMRAAQHLISVLSDDTDIHIALQLQKLRVYEQRLSEKKNHLNQALPRMEYAVDLGLIERTGAGRRARDPVYAPTPTTHRFVNAFQNYRSDPSALHFDLDDIFVGGIAATYNLPAAPIQSELEALLWFTRGYQLVKRPAGFTPGRSAAFAGCILALENRKRIEVSEMFNYIYKAAEGPWNNHLGFSGGSRFDREFLIRIDERLESELLRNMGGN